MSKVISFLFVALFLVSCSEYQKALKSDDVAVKNETAGKLYEAGKYTKAIRLYEQIAPAYKGKPSAERMFYFYSMSLYKSNQFYLAGYQLENFVATYPKSEKREECAFNAPLKSEIVLYCLAISNAFFSNFSRNSFTYALA